MSAWIDGPLKDAILILVSSTFRATSGGGRNPGLYAGCAWLFAATALGGLAYWGLGWAGPSGVLVVVGLLLIAALTFARAVAVWTGFGGRKTAGLSLLLGAGLMVAYAVEAAISDAEWSSENIAVAAVGLGIVLASTFAFVRLPRSMRR
jgi:hypothetical protein